jgi:type I restriction enzyme S subunit
MHKGYKREIPTDWKSYQIRDAISFTGGSQPPLSTFVYEEKEGYVRLIQTRDYRTDKYKTYIREEDAKKTCTSDDIIIGRYGPPLFQIFRGLDGAYNVALLKAIPDEKHILKDYCFYYLSRPELQNYLEGLSQRSGGQTGVEMDMLYKYPLPLPPLPEQQKIAEILSTWDDAIRITKDSIIETKKRNKGLAQQLLTGKKRLNGFSRKWNEVKADKIFKNHTDKTHNGELEVLSATQENGVIPRSMNNIDIKFDASSLNTYKKVEVGDFVISLRSFQGGIEYSEYEGIVSPAYTVLKEVAPISKMFYRIYLKTETFINRLNTIIYGIRDGKQIGFKDFSTLKLPYPEPKEQEAIASILTDAHNELKILEEKLETLMIQKKGLMQQLLTGEKRVTI